MAYTLAQQLEYVETAIRNVEAGVQSITQADGSVMNYPSLDVLYKRWKDLKDAINQEIASESTKPMSQRLCEFDNGLS